MFSEVHVNSLDPLPYHKRLRNPFKGAGRDGIQDMQATCPTTEKTQMCEPMLSLRAPSCVWRRILQTPSATNKLLHCMHPETATNLSCVFFFRCVVLCSVFVCFLVLKLLKQQLLFSDIFCRINFISFTMCWGKTCKSQMPYDSVNAKYFPASYQYDAKIHPCCRAFRDS